MIPTNAKPREIFHGFLSKEDLLITMLTPGTTEPIIEPPRLDDSDR